MSTKPKHYKIYKGEDIPQSGQSYGAFLPLKDMEIGDHFTIAPGDVKRVKVLLDSYGKKNGCSFILNWNGEQSAKVWRNS